MERGREFIRSEKGFFHKEKEFKEKVEKLLKYKERRKIEEGKRNKYNKL